MPLLLAHRRAVRDGLGTSSRRPLLICALILSLTVLSTVSAAPQQSGPNGRSLREVYGLGDLNPVNYDVGNLPDNAIPAIREDRYNPETFFLLSIFTIKRFTPGQPVELFLGNPNQASLSYVEGNSSVAEFTFVNDMVQYNKTKYAIVDFRNNCVREYDSESDLVLPLIGRCSRDGTSRGIRLGETIPKDSHFLSGPLEVALVESKNYFLIIDFGYGQLTKFDIDSGTVQLLLNSSLPNPSSLLVDPQEKFLYVSHTYGLSIVNLDSLEVTLLLGEATPTDNIDERSLVVGAFDTVSVGVLGHLSWLIPNKAILALDSTNEALVLIDLTEKNVQTSCGGSLNSTRTLVGSQDECGLNVPNAIAVSNNAIVIATMKVDSPADYRFTRESELYTIQRGEGTATSTNSTDGELCPMCPTNVRLENLEEVSRDMAGFVSRPIDVIKEDRYKPGTFYYNSGSALMRFVPGQPIERFLGTVDQPNKRHTDGNSSVAEFSIIHDFLQYNKTKMLIADYLNNCVREYDFETDLVTHFVGNCTATIADSKNLASEEVVNSTAHFLGGILAISMIESRNMLLMCDFGYRYISKYDLNTRKVQLLDEKLINLLPNPSNFLKNEMETEIYVSHSYGISRLNLDSLEVTKILGTTIADEGKMDVPFVPGPFSQAQIGLVDGMEWLIPNEIFVTFGTQSIESLLFVDLRAEKVYSACDGSDKSNMTVTGGLDICELNSPTSVSVASDGTIYIGALADGNNPLSYKFRSNSTLYKINTKESRCYFRPPTGYEIVAEPDITYFQYAEVSVSCPAGMGMASHLRTRVCAENSLWNAPLPSCVKITSFDDVESIAPLTGQISGGTQVTIRGLVPDVGAEIYSMNGDLVSLNYTVGNQELSFRMPSSSSVGPVEIIVKLTENVTGTYEFLYTEDPVVNYTVSASTIVSGGFDVVFNVINADSSNYYTLQAEYKDYNVSCAREKSNVSCNTKAFSELLIELPTTITMGLSSDEVFVKGSNVSSLMVYPDPQFDAIPLTLSDGEPLNLTGKSLNVGVLNDKYEITIEAPNDTIIQCTVLDITGTELRCRPEIGEQRPSSEPSDVYIRLGNFKLKAVKVVFLPLQTGPVTSGPVTSGPVLSENVLSGNVIGAIVGVIVVVLTVAVAIIIFFWRRKRELSILHLEEAQINSVRFQKEKDNWFVHINLDLKAKLDPLLIEPETLKLKDAASIGEGNFGKIFLGQLYRGEVVRTVAVKTLKELETSMKEIEKFLEEAVILQDFKHANVLSTLGVCIPDSETPQVVLPYMANGDLKSLIQMENIDFTIGDLMHFASQVSCGMEYLATNKFIHRDLAARNCLVSEKYIVRIADFGLSRDVYSDDYYRRDEANGVPLPIKWLAIESLRSGVFTSTSDVWSYGVLVWELCTRGTLPYSDVDPWDQRGYLEEGRRLHQPSYCPPDIWELMSSCWFEEPEDRPTFTQIHNLLSTLLEGTECAPKSSYSYIREYTKDIPHDYADNEVDVEELDYLNPVQKHERKQNDYPCLPTSAGSNASANNGYVF